MNLLIPLVNFISLFLWLLLPTFLTYSILSQKLYQPSVSKSKSASTADKYHCPPLMQIHEDSSDFVSCGHIRGRVCGRAGALHLQVNDVADREAV